MYDPSDKMSRGSPGEMNTGICQNKNTDKYIRSFIILLQKDEENYDENIVLKEKIYDSIMKGLEGS